MDQRLHRPHHRDRHPHQPAPGPRRLPRTRRERLRALRPGLPRRRPARQRRGRHIQPPLAVLERGPRPPRHAPLRLERPAHHRHGSRPHRDGRPELGGAAFDTVALQNLTDPAAYANELTETLELFAAISRLPDRHLDVIVLRRLCGFTHEAVSALLGTSLATVRSDERHATRFLDSVIPPPRTEGTTP
ncbi:RNA polymerase sigma factor [Streptomyces mutabilis]|uniref:RNA polymerase sigma factor n=1 Tax=Streptomyces mutabilis TaxID=67332 RepID=UPI0034E00CA3